MQNIHSFGVSKFIFQHPPETPSTGPVPKREKVEAGVHDPAMQASRKLEKVEGLSETEPFKEAASVTGLKKIGEEFDKVRQTIEANQDGLRLLGDVEWKLRNAIVGSTPTSQAERTIILDYMEYLDNTSIDPNLLARRRQELKAMTFEEENKEGMGIEWGANMDAVMELHVIYQDLRSFHDGDYILDGGGVVPSSEYVTGTPFPQAISAIPQRLEMVAVEYLEPHNNAEKQMILKYLDARLKGQDTSYNEAYKGLDSENRTQDPSIGRHEENRVERQEQLLARKKYIENLTFSR